MPSRLTGRPAHHLPHLHALKVANMTQTALAISRDSRRTSVAGDRSPRRRGWPSTARAIALMAALALGSFGGGCGQSHEPGGGGPGDGGGGGTGLDGGPGGGSGDGSVTSLDAAVSGSEAGDRAGDVWDGYIESLTFPSGSDQVHIVFDSATGDGPRTGIVVFGMGTPPPPATDPNVGYPPGVMWISPSTMLTLFGQPWEGFAYPILHGSVSGARVQLTVSPGSLWETWCELQTPVPQASSGYGCLPVTGGVEDPTGCLYTDPSTGAAVSVDCGKFFLCTHRVCTCDMNRCTADTTHQVAFDFHVSGDAGDGSVMLDTLHSVHVTRTR